MAKVSKQMTRIVIIGKLDEYKLQTEPFTIGKGVIDLGNGTKARFTLFNKDKEGVENPHTKANDFEAQFEVGDFVYITGQDNRSYSEAKDTYYDDVNVWDFRAANEDEQHRWVYVYIGDIKDIDDEVITLGITNYKKIETLFPITLGKTRLPLGLEVGDRIKVKGSITNERVEDYYGDGQFQTIRRAAEVTVVNNKAEVDAEERNAEAPGGSSEKGLW